MFTTLPGLQRLDLLATDGVLEAGYLDRVRLGVRRDRRSASRPRLPTRRRCWSCPTERRRMTRVDWHYRDREDELEAVARRVKAAAGRQPFDTHRARGGAATAVSLSRARGVCIGADLPFEALDTLPLAAEPYAAAVDVVLECAAANFTQAGVDGVVALSRISASTAMAVDLDRAAVSRLDQCLAAQRYLGGLDRLTALTDTLTGAERRGRGRRAVDRERAGAAAGDAARSRIRSISCASSSSTTHDR